MPHVTAILGNEVGIQYQGVKDSSSLTASYPVVGVMIGQFRRGRLDKPMTITRQNIKTKLGYDPTNPDYIAVQDALDSGVPSVQVLRVLNTSLMCLRVTSGSGYIYPEGVSMGGYLQDGYTREMIQLAMDEMETTLTFEVDDSGKKMPYIGLYSNLQIMVRRNSLHYYYEMSELNNTAVVCCAMPFTLGQAM